MSSVMTCVDHVAARTAYPLQPTSSPWKESGMCLLKISNLNTHTSSHIFFDARPVFDDATRPPRPTDFSILNNFSQCLQRQTRLGVPTWTHPHLTVTTLQKRTNRRSESYLPSTSRGLLMQMICLRSYLGMKRNKPMAPFGLKQPIEAHQIPRYIW
jgi:hypothetical protein